MRSNKSFWYGVGISLSLLAFLFLAREVLSPQNLIVTSDVWFEATLATLRTPFFLQVFRGITLLGDVSVVVGITIVVSIGTFFSKRWRVYGAGLVIAVIGAGISDYGIKMLVARARPNGIIPAVHEIFYSFPSAHAILSVTLYGFIAYMLHKQYPKYSRSIVSIAVLIILTIGFSRLYLGVHFPSDVIAGYLLGGVWLLLGIEVIGWKLSTSSTPSIFCYTRK